MTDPKRRNHIALDAALRRGGPHDTGRTRAEEEREAIAEQRDLLSELETEAAEMVDHDPGWREHADLLMCARESLVDYYALLVDLRALEWELREEAARLSSDGGWEDVRDIPVIEEHADRIAAILRKHGGEEEDHA